MYYYLFCAHLPSDFLKKVERSKNQKSLEANSLKGLRVFIYGDPPGTRTPNLLIKSQMLYQLS